MARSDQCSLIAGTIFESSKMELTRRFMALQLLSQAKNNVAALELMRQLGVSYPTAWLMKHKIMEAMRPREAKRQLHGRVEIALHTALGRLMATPALKQQLVALGIEQTFGEPEEFASPIRPELPK